MRFQHTATISHPPAHIIALMIERMEEIVPFLLNVETIELLEREELPGGRIRIARYWQATEESIPTTLRRFLSKELIGWIDNALWTPAECKVEWNMTTKFSKFFDASGTNYYEPGDDGHSTNISITGNMTVYPERLPGMPEFLASRLKPQVERFVIEMIAPNLTDVAMGLQEYLDRNAR